MKKIKIEIDGQWQEIEISEESYVEFEKAAKPKFKEGDWVISNEKCYRPNSARRVIEINLSNQIVHYTDPIGFKNGQQPSTLRLATTEEIISYFESEAERRGYVKGVKVRCLMNNIIYKLSDKRHSSPLMMDENGFWMTAECGAGVYVCENGKWAKIISSTIELNNGLEATIKNNGFVFNYIIKAITFESVKKLNDAILK